MPPKTYTLTEAQLDVLEGIRESLLEPIPPPPAQLQNMGLVLMATLRQIRDAAPTDAQIVEALDPILTAKEVAQLDALGPRLALVPANNSNLCGARLLWAQAFLLQLRAHPDQRDALRAALRKVLQQTDNGASRRWEQILLLLSNERNPETGWLEYGIQFRGSASTSTGDDRYIAVIQRTINAQVEFHS